MLDVRQLNFVFEVYSALMCAAGMVCIAVMLPKGENRRFVFQLYICAFLMCVGDALAGAFRGQAGAGAAVGVHAGNFLAFAAPQAALAFYASNLCRVLGEALPGLVWWRRIAWALAALCIAYVLAGGAYTIDAHNVYQRAPGFWV